MTEATILGDAMMSAIVTLGVVLLAILAIDRIMGFFEDRLR